MADRAHPFGNLPREIQNNIWTHELSQPGIHFICLTINAPGAHNPRHVLNPGPRGAWLITSPVINGQQRGWSSMSNVSAYSRVPRIRNTCRAAREYLDGLLLARFRTGHLIGLRIGHPSLPAPPVVIDPADDLVVMQLDFPPFDRIVTYRGADPPFWGSFPHSLNPQVMRQPLDLLVLSSIFPQLRRVRKLGVHVEAQHLQRFHALGPQDWHIEMVKVYCRYLYETLFLPCHFPSLEAVYVVDETIVMQEGATPSPWAERFYGNGVEYVELVMGDETKWIASPESIQWYHYYSRRHISLLDASKWAAGQQSAITHGTGALGIVLMPILPVFHLDAPGFWMNIPDDYRRLDVKLVGRRVQLPPRTQRRGHRRGGGFGMT
ncbi:hypothetical protein NKR23_g9559 [Pleurostoma richardsiae]|uniref:2EXR domain-containing protein n=1 Tax=Pleurostoma richardsiae TaxID=41990 RepID=A0AA38R5U4_9PEZI|nr:hypothetical protein NKR23_g9559 [Pleurostoma richardsiae]